MLNHPDRSPALAALALLGLLLAVPFHSLKAIQPQALEQQSTAKAEPATGQVAEKATERTTSNGPTSDGPISDGRENLGVAAAVSEMQASSGERRVELQLALLKRRDLSIAMRESIARELIAGDHTDPLILGSAYAALGGALGMQGEFVKALPALEKAEEYGRQCAARAPNVFFNARCNRAMFLSAAQGDRDQTVTLLQEAIEFSKPFSTQLEIGFPYITLAHLAEESGAVHLALEYVETAFRLAAENGKADTAAQAGETIIAILFADAQYDLAEQWIPKVAPWIEKANDPMVKVSFAMRREDLRCKTGDPQGAATALVELAAKHKEPQQLSGLIHLSLASALLACEEYQDGLVAADVAIDRLQKFSRNKLLATLVRLECLNESGESEAALAGCDAILADEQAGSLVRIGTLALRSQALKALGRYEDSYAVLEQCRAEEHLRSAERSREQANFMTVVYNSRQKDQQLALAREQKAAAETQAALHKATAQKEMATAANARLIKNMTIVLSLVVGGLFLLVMQTRWHRNSTLALAKREHELNEQMQERLAAQASELQEQLMTRRQLEMAVERKFRDEAIGKLTGGVAHDFNNLLMVIVHSLELLRQSNPTLKHDSAQLLDAMMQAAESGASIVSQLMAYARQQPLTPRPVAISDWLRSTSGMLRQTMGKQIEYQERDLSEDATICIDMAQLTTAVINLLANARDAIKENSDGPRQISLTITQMTLDKSLAQEWSDLDPGRYCKFEIRDNGKGMTEEQLAHACEPFYTTKNPGAGTGLGLSSVVGFVKQSGGDFRLISQPGSGTIAQFLLPQCDPEPVRASTSSPVAQPPARQRLLLVEDQEQVRMVLATGLQSIGYLIIQAANADEAVRIIEKDGLPDIVLSDVRMPGSMNGLELRRWILKRYPTARVVLMSGYRDQETEEDPGLIFVQKPVKLQELHRLLTDSSSPLRGE